MGKCGDCGYPTDMAAGCAVEGCEHREWVMSHAPDSDAFEHAEAPDLPDDEVVTLRLTRKQVRGFKSRVVNANSLVATQMVLLDLLEAMEGE